MYHAVVERIARRSFAAVNAHDYETVLAACRPDIHHRFGGDHALGGERHDREALRAWFERLGRIVPSLKLTVTDVWVKGFPWNTVVFARWTATAEPEDGAPYANHGVHIVTMRWGKVAAIDANEDSQAVADLLQRQARAGIAEAAQPPIVS